MKSDSSADGRKPRRKDIGRSARADLYALEATLRSQEDKSALNHEALGKLLGVVELLNAELDVERVLNVAAQQIIEVFEAERAFMADLGTGGQLRFRLAVDFQGQRIPHPEDEVSHAVIQQVVQTRVPVLVENATDDPRFADVSSVRTLKLHSVMAAPLLAREALLGVVYVDNRTLPGVFSVRKLDLLRVLANHVAIALRNAELFDQLDVARSELALSERLRAIGQVATFVAHEVKNPLASIRILLDGLQEKWADAEFRSKVFDMVPREVARLDKAVSQILEYARPTPLIKVPVCLSSLVDSAVAILEPEMERRQVRVERLFQPDLPTVLADGERLREVFVNVIKNGIQALTRRPEKQLRLFIQRPDELHEEVVVEDTGPGLAEADIQGLFEPFRALRGSATGVGLALCQKVIREHGGRITAENLPDGGARLRISLPIGGA